ncbi:MAG: hypothetical protein OES99_09315, partial [Gammaproteobacteria bacterium]|nr:hypothetical protein [Gammaproteobacteria bacterium]
LAGDLSKAREYIVRRAPQLEGDGELPVDRLTVRNVVKLAYIHRQNGDTKRADELLKASLAVVQGMPRHGMFGHGILDVQIYALLDRREEAFVALKEAVEGGYRSSVLFDNWLLDIDPFLQSIRPDRRFEETLDKLAGFNAAMHQRIIEAEESGDWDQLMALVETF